jgi:hypothetical protein
MSIFVLYRYSVRRKGIFVIKSENIVYSQILNFIIKVKFIWG